MNWQAVITSVVLLGMMGCEWKKLRKPACKREKGVFAVLWVLASLIMVAHTMDIVLLNPIEWVHKAFKPINGMMK